MPLSWSNYIEWTAPKRASLRMEVPKSGFGLKFGIKYATFYLKKPRVYLSSIFFSIIIDFNPSLDPKYEIA